jgi:cytochrome P450
MSTDLHRFDPSAPGFFEDPYPQYARLREHCPVAVDGRGIAFCFAHDDVRALLRDAEATSMDRKRSIDTRGRARSAPPTFPLGLVNRDPPDHTRLRRLLARAFTPRAIESLVAAMEEQVAGLLDALEDAHRETGEPVDLVTGLASPFPFRVISELLGMPDGDDTRIRGWARAVSGASDPSATREQVEVAVDAYRRLRAYVDADVLPWKRRNPADDLLSALLAAHADDQLSVDELLDHVALLYVAGHETTSGLIGNGILNLLRHPGERARLRADPSLLANAIEELNRYDSSVQFAWRYVVRDLALPDVVLPRGTMAFVCVASANRDPARFGESADRLDITRADAKDALSFGAGIHFCIGAPLARRETSLVIDRLFTRFPTLELAGAPRWNARVTFRSLDHLPVSLR